MPKSATDALFDALKVAFPALNVAHELSRVVEKTLPTNARTYAETIKGDRSKIVESNLTEKELNKLRENTKQALIDRQNRILNQEALVKALTENPEEFKSIVDTEGGRFVHKTNKDVLPSEQNRLEKMKQLPAMVGYEPTDEYKGFFDLNDWVDSVVASLTSPQYQLDTTLGTSTIRQDSSGNTHVVDSYDFNKDGPGAHIIRSLRKGDVRDASRALGHPTQLLDAIGYLFAPETEKNRRPVDINLGKIPQGKQK